MLYIHNQSHPQVRSYGFGALRRSLKISSKEIFLRANKWCYAKIINLIIKNLCCIFYLKYFQENFLAEFSTFKY